jgi:glycosyltransferase involved in cell wall biosynthesis
MPRVSVLMAAYNAEKYVREAIDSILAQSFGDFEFIIINDASDDATGKVIGSYRDPRILNLDNRENLGQTRSVNSGLEVSRGEYIARMDADDVAEPNRLLREVEYLDSHSGVAAVATWARVIREDGRSLEVWTASPNPGVLAWELSWRCPIINSTVMMRRSAIAAYDIGFRYIEDHKLWTELVKDGKVISVLPEALSFYRLSPGQIGSKHRIGQRDELLKSAKSYVEWLLDRSVNVEQVEGMINLYRGERLEKNTNVALCVSLAREVGYRCQELYGGVGASEIRDRMSDALIQGAAGVLKEGGHAQARRSILSALRDHPLRAARPWTFHLLASSVAKRDS